MDTDKVFGRVGSDVISYPCLSVFICGPIPLDFPNVGDGLVEGRFRVIVSIVVAP
jgi:hypothetical protein